MTDILAQYGPLGLIAIMLAGVVSILVKQRRNGNGWDGIERRANTPRVVVDLRGLGEDLKPLLDVRGDINGLRDELRDTRHDIGRELQSLVTKVAVMEREIQHVRERCPIHQREAG